MARSGILAQLKPASNTLSVLYSAPSDSSASAVLTVANDELAKGEMDSTDYQVLVDFVNYYVLREIDKR